ncbi:phage distal tail protein [Gordonia sp. CNJ-863]|uniref:phage distal tail protein n=1 Tax=Gordonia sp. CNJ-863 TaxID=1904963 RepID=UPI0037BFFD1E
MAGDSYIVDIYFDKPLMNMESPIHATYQVTGVCADPFIFGASTVTSAQIRPPSGGGYAVPMIVPYISDASVGGSITLTNDGTETAMPVITLTGLLTQPVLSNQTTGKRLELNYVLPEGEPLTIDMENQLIIRSGASQIGAKTIASDWWGLAPGPNAISLTTMSSSDTGYALLTFNPPYMGV